jgi:hypothetical protein
MDPLYKRDGTLLLPTDLTRGPWNPEHQHAGPPSALLANAAERAAGIHPGQSVRLSFDILGPIPVAPLTVEAEVLRPGRRVELIEARLLHDGSPVMRATVWRMRAEPTVSGEPDPPPPGPDGGHPGSFGFWRDERGYKEALDWSFVEGDFGDPGPATVWTRVRGPLIEGEEITPLERVLVMADAASGVSAVLDWDEWLFSNVDLGIHLERPPQGEWMAMAARTRLGDQGAALAESVLYDSRGRVGVSTQGLLVTARNG